MPNDKRQRDWDANLAKDRYLNPERARKKIRKRRKRKLLIALGILLGVLIVLFTTFHVLRAMGKNKLQANAASKAHSIKNRVEMTSPLVTNLSPGALL
jgi:flagellar basal body-associated protein FliL